MLSWLVVVTAAVTPLLAFFGAFTGHLWSRQSARELDTWRRREEAMRMLRWAVELATGDQVRPGAAGIAALQALVDSELLQPVDKKLLGVITDSVLQPETAEYDSAIALGDAQPPLVEVEEVEHD